MKYLNKIILIIITLFVFNSCSDDEAEFINIFGAAFNTISLNLDEASIYNIPIVFNLPASENGTITIAYSVENANYDVDFNTIPNINSDNKIIVNFSENDLETSFTFNKLQDALQGLDKKVTFEIIEISHSGSQISGNITTQISFNGVASLGTSLEPNLGGPNQNNSVFIDLSSEIDSSAQRDTWDLGFYSGAVFRVMLNATIGMGAGQLNTFDIDATSSSDAEVQTIQSEALISTFSDVNVPYFDGSNGDINSVIINEVFNNDNDNKVYIVNLGFELSNETPAVGSSNINGDLKGWKKIRVLKDNDNYILQYADLDETTHQEVTISKNDAYNFTFFNFDTNTEVIVEPEKDKWDLHFSPYNQEFLQGTSSFGFIFFSDMVLTNTKNNVSVYLIDGDYDSFITEDINYNAFSLDHTIIGSSWRNVFDGTVTSNRFYVIKDTDNNIYKIEFTSLLGTDSSNLGERGFPQFRYEFLE